MTNQTYTPQPSPRYISTTECAKIIRTELKVTFPGIKFSVKSHSYAGGSHVSVSWFDGPTEEQVNAVTYHFDGSTFDGMIDLKSYHDSEYNGETVHFSNDGTSYSRNYSEAFLTKAVAYLCKRHGYRMPKITVSSYNGSASIEGDYYVEDRQCHLQTLLWREYRTIPGDLIDNIEVISDLADWLDQMAYTVYYPIYKAEEKRNRKQYLTTELLPILKSQRDGFQRLGDEEAVKLLDESIASKEQELAMLSPETTYVDHIAAFFQAAYDYCYTQVSDYLPQPHEWVYGSHNRPISASWARIPEAHYIQIDHKANDGIYTWVVVPYQLDEKTIASYELHLICQPEQVQQQEEEVAMPLGTVVTVLEAVNDQKRVRVLQAGEHTPYTATIGGEIAFYLKRYNAKLVDLATFEAVLNSQVA